MPLFVGDWLTGTATFAMTNRQRGAFMQLLCHAWKQQASLPNEPKLLAKYADEDHDWLTSDEGQAVLAQFPVGTDGRRRNAKQAETFERATTLREERAESARKAAEKRWGRGGSDGPGAEPPDSDGSADALRPVSPSPSASSSPSPKKAEVDTALSGSLERFALVVAWIGADANRKLLIGDGADRIAAEGDLRAVHGFVAALNASLQEGHKPEVIEQALTDWLGRFKSFTTNSLRIAIASAARNTRAVAEIGAAKSKSPSTRQAENPARATKLTIA